MPRGRILPKYEITCGLCPKREDVQGVTAVQRRMYARDRGWRLSRKDGWLCCACHATLGGNLTTATGRGPADLKDCR